MQINLESSEAHTIQAYDSHGIQINSIYYQRSLIVSSEEIISDLTIKKIQDINLEYIDLLMKFNPKIILIGHEKPGQFPPLTMTAYLSQLGIGIESMSIGAACRTFNVLLSEQRAVVAGFIV